MTHRSDGMQMPPGFDPFAHMAGTLAAEKPARSWLSAPEVRPLPEGVTRTAAMLTLLATGPQPAAALAAAAGGIPSAAVSAILKTQIKRGQVRLEAGVYELVPDYEADLRDRLKEAAALLRANGYAVSRRAGT